MRVRVTARRVRGEAAAAGPRVQRGARRAQRLEAQDCARTHLRGTRARIALASRCQAAKARIEEPLQLQLARVEDIDPTHGPPV
eukprot:6179119-Pleurochrysis_carterae.AAC.1